jgi:hypothetical protein
MSKCEKGKVLIAGRCVTSTQVRDSSQGCTSTEREFLTPENTRVCIAKDVVTGGMYKDSDRDGVPDAIDCQPNNPDAQEWTYEQADVKLKEGVKKDSKKIDNNTYLIRRGEDIAIKLHDTDVVTLKKDGTKVLNTGGWVTPTTKDRINSALGNERIIQKKRQWYLESGGDEIPFQDNMKILPSGQIEGGGSVSDVDQKKKVKTQIDRYANDYIDKLFHGEVPGPSTGDCWHCSMREVGTNVPLGELSRSDHLESHIKEKYYVPSLLVNAITEVPVSSVAKGTLGEIWAGQRPAEGRGSMDDIARDQLKASLKRYMYRQEGLSR